MNLDRLKDALIWEGRKTDTDRMIKVRNRSRNIYIYISQARECVGSQKTC